MCYPTGAFVRSESSPLQIAFLTGQSDPASCALSTEQGAFLRQLQGTGRQLVDCNYPYRRNSAPHRRTPLWRASLSNARQYLAARHARLAEADRKRVPGFHCRQRLAQMLGQGEKQRFEGNALG